MKRYIQKIDELNGKRGKSKGIPRALEFGIEELSRGGMAVRVDVAKGGGGTGLRKVDVWTVAVISELKALGGNREVRELRIALGSTPKKADLESFRRRICYLALNNEWKVDLATPAGPVALISDMETLLNPDPREKVHTTWQQRKDSDDRDGAVEKMLQTWLAGTDRKNNHRLAILGEDFMFSDKEKLVEVLREVPTGAFEGSIRENNRILPTYWIDLVTLNKHRRLAVVELKVSDANLEVMAQALDYALFCRSYWRDLAGPIRERLNLMRKHGMEIYVVNNRFHPRFDGIGRYYQPRTDECDFRFKKVVLGGTLILGDDSAGQ